MKTLIVVVVGEIKKHLPIVITSISTVAGLLPLAYGLGGSGSIYRPMALAIGYGLLFSTPLTLFLLPALYLIQIDITKAISKLTGNKKTQQDQITETSSFSPSRDAFS